MSVPIPIGNLVRICDPFSNPWGDGPLSIDEVLDAVDRGNLIATPFSKDILKIDENWSRDMHIQRIAYLIVHGWNEPIQIDVGVPSLGFAPQWIVEDGNHRLAAAIARGDTVIERDVAGDVDYARRLLGVEVTEGPALEPAKVVSEPGPRLAPVRGFSM